MRVRGTDHGHGDSPEVPPSEPTLRFVVITADDEFYGRLEQIASSCRWLIARAASIEDAVAPIGDSPTPLIVYESMPGDGDWQSGLRRLNELPAHPCVLLASRVSDDNLLREVVRNHGYDILPKAATSEKLIRCLNFAWLALAWGRGRI